MEASKKEKKTVPTDVQRVTLCFEHWVGVRVILEMLHCDCTHVKHKTQKYIHFYYGNIFLVICSLTAPQLQTEILLQHKSVHRTDEWQRY
jgi:hypothetical protein